MGQVGRGGLVGGGIGPGSNRNGPEISDFFVAGKVTERWSRYAWVVAAVQQVKFWLLGVGVSSIF